MRSLRAFLASLGASTCLVLAGALAMAALSTVVGFSGFPGGRRAAPPAPAAVLATTHGGDVAGSSGAVLTLPAPGARGAGGARRTAAAGRGRRVDRVRAGTHGSSAFPLPGAAAPAAGAPSVPDPVATAISMVVDQLAQVPDTTRAPVATAAGPVRTLGGALAGAVQAAGNTAAQAVAPVAPSAASTLAGTSGEAATAVDGATARVANVVDGLSGGARP